MSKVRYFPDLTDEEADEAIGKVFRRISDDYENGRISPLSADDSPLDEAELQDWLWDTAGALARDATFIPDDGTVVVRL